MLRPVSAVPSSPASGIPESAVAPGGGASDLPNIADPCNEKMTWRLFRFVELWPQCTISEIGGPNGCRGHVVCTAQWLFCSGSPSVGLLHRATVAEARERLHRARVEAMEALACPAAT